MKRIMIIGNCGAGKSTLARKIHELTQLPLVHLDQHYWQPGWIETDLEIWRRKVAKMVAEDSWIIDGNYGSTMIPRLERADTIILLEIPTWKALARVIKRVRQYKGVSRPDMPENCVEKLDLSFLHYVAMYNLTRKPHNHKRLKEYGKDKDIHILRSDKQIEEFLKALSATTAQKNDLN